MHDHLIAADTGGRPIIAGTHVTVETILKELAALGEVDQILTAHPDLDREAVQATLAFAAEKMHETAQPSALGLARAVGEFTPRTPLAQKLWERRKAVIREALERGEPLLETWEEMRREVCERRGGRDYYGDEGDL